MKKQNNTNPVPTPTELSGVKLQLGNDHAANGKSLMATIEDIMCYHDLVGLVALIQYRSGARVSEVLSLKWSDEFQPQNFVIEGMKNSRAFEIYLPEIELFRKYKQKYSDLVFQSLNRSTVYRSYIKFGIILQRSAYENNTVTHTFRKLKAKKVSKLGKTSKTKQDLLKHNSETSQKYYE